MNSLFETYFCPVQKGRLKSIVFGVGIALFIPMIAFFILRFSGHDGHFKLPPVYFIDTVIRTEKKGMMKMDTVYHEVADEMIRNHLNKESRLRSAFKNKILVIQYLKPENFGDSSIIYMSHLQQAFQKKDSILRIITLCPDDMPLDTIRQYADQFSMNHDTWWFVKLKDRSLNTFIEEELNFPAEKQMALVDKYGNIRGYYGISNEKEYYLCANDIPFLLLEKNVLHEKKKR